MHQACFGCVVGAGLAVLAGALFCNAFLGQTLINWSYDLPFSYRAPATPSDIVIVSMDERSREELGQSWRQPWAWDRRLHARLLDRLKADGSRAVVFDVVFSRDLDGERPSDKTSAGNSQLAAAMRAHGKVVIASHLMLQDQEGLLRGTALETPDDVFLEAATGIGVLEVKEDADTTVRLLLPRIPVEGGTSYVTLDWEAARVEGAPVTRGPGPSLGRWYIKYYGPPRTIRSVSYYQALQEVPAGYFSNRVVVVGEFYQVSLPGAKIDTFRSPFSAGKARFDGAEIHATILENYLHEDWLRRLPGWVEFGLLMVIGGGLGFVLPRLRPLTAAGAALGAMALLTAFAFALHWQARLWFPWLIPVAIQIPLVLLWTILFHAIRAYVESHVLEHSLSLYLSSKQVRNILQRPDLLKPGGVQQRISILASDIANFSKLSERMDAEDLVKLLNQYYEDAIACVHETDGTVVNLIGDAIFAVWNAPQAQPDHQELACRAALRLQSRIVQFNSRTDIPPLSTRVGLHTGVACVGNVGSSSHFAYTAVGEAVNLSFRLDGLNKQLDTRILATRDFLKGIHGAVTSRRLGLFRFKGFDAVVEVHEVLGAAADAESSKAWREAFARGLHHFQRRSFDAAEAAFKDTLAVRPDDGPAQFYLERVRELREAALPREWAGEIELKEK